MFKIVSNKNSLEWNERCVYGELYIIINDLYFPNDKWTDILSSVLGMWIDNIILLLQKPCINDAQEFFFMDGSYSFKIKFIKENMIDINFYNDDIKRNQYSCQIQFSVFLEQIYQIVNMITMDERLNDVKGQKEVKEKFDLLKNKI